MKELEILAQIKKTREYLDYIEEHVLNVEKAWKEIQDKCSDMNFISDDYLYNLIDTDIQKHDLSKLSEYEFVQYRKAFFPTPLEGKEGEYDMSEAWEHHKKLNPHHWQTWTEGGCAWEVHCVHMIADWMAMGYKFNETAQQYYEKNRSKIKLPHFAVRFMYKIFRRIEKEIV